MRKKEVFVGIDVAKEELEVAVFPRADTETWPNTEEGVLSTCGPPEIPLPHPGGPGGYGWVGDALCLGLWLQRAFRWSL